MKQIQLCCFMGLWVLVCSMTIQETGVNIDIQNNAGALEVLTLNASLSDIGELVAQQNLSVLVMKNLKRNLWTLNFTCIPKFHLHYAFCFSSRREEKDRCLFSLEVLNLNTNQFSFLPFNTDDYAQSGYPQVLALAWNSSNLYLALRSLTKVKLYGFNLGHFPEISKLFEVNINQHLSYIPEPFRIAACPINNSLIFYFNSFVTGDETRKGVINLNSLESISEPFISHSVHRNFLEIHQDLTGESFVAYCIYPTAIYALWSSKAQKHHLLLDIDFNNRMHAIISTCLSS